jgi:hypothetical protein
MQIVSQESRLALIILDKIYFESKKLQEIKKDIFLVGMGLKLRAACLQSRYSIA